MSDFLMIDAVIVFILLTVFVMILGFVDIYIEGKNKRDK